MTAKTAKSGKRWSGRVTKHSHALRLEEGVFTFKDPKKTAESLKRSAEASTQRKSEPYRSAMSMLTFYINRAGKSLSKADRDRLEKAKAELRKIYGKEPAKPASAKKRTASSGG